MTKILSTKRLNNQVNGIKSCLFISNEMGGGGITL